MTFESQRRIFERPIGRKKERRVGEKLKGYPSKGLLVPPGDLKGTASTTLLPFEELRVDVVRKGKSGVTFQLSEGEVDVIIGRHGGVPVKQRVGDIFLTKKQT